MVKNIDERMQFSNGLARAGGLVSVAAGVSEVGVASESFHEVLDVEYLF